MIGGTTIEVDDRQVKAAFARLAARAVDPGPILDEIGDNLTEMRRARFIRGQGPNRVPWKAKRPRKDGKNLPLVVSGRLRDTLAWQREGDAVLIGSDLPYARIHELGGEITQYAYSRKVGFRAGTVRGQQRQVFARRQDATSFKPVTYGERLIKIPARPFLAPDAEDTAEIQDIVDRQIQRAIGGAA
ncbi:phage virion morphogenesis protein [Falsiroseomonas sp.]|uniref:phage virion morphogenesis protein n=1 Tax=Falsiroseomonas sp. TaxID=2870721 RepID=UPI003F72614A